jgi:cell shape-determining protein MreC
MAYATDNPIKKVAQMGGNSLWFYTDGDATSSIVADDYFNSASAELKQGDMILVAAGVGGTMESDLLVVKSATGAASVTTAKLA